MGDLEEATRDGVGERFGVCFDGDGAGREGGDECGVVFEDLHVT